MGEKKANLISKSNYINFTQVQHALGAKLHCNKISAPMCKEFCGSNAALPLAATRVEAEAEAEAVAESEARRQSLRKVNRDRKCQVLVSHC